MIEVNFRADGRHLLWDPSVDLIQDQDPTSCRGPIVNPSDGGLLGSGSHLFAYLMAIKIPGVFYCRKLLETVLTCGP